MKDKLDKVIEGLEKLEKRKRFKLPLGIRMQKGKIKKNYAVVMIVRTNGTVYFKMIAIEDNTIKVGEIYHEATAGHILRYKKYPLIILPEWNIKPFSPSENIKEAIKDGSLSSAEKFILHKVKMESVSKSKISMKVILIVLGLIVGVVVLLDYLKVF